jgi:hypothetical protein
MYAKNVTTKSTLVLLAIIIATLSILNIACSDDMDMDDLPRMGDAMKISEKLEETVCKSQGGIWSNKHNRCN